MDETQHIATKDEMKAEAIKMMRILGLSKEVIKDFDENGVLFYSERMSVAFPAVLYWMSNKEEYMGQVAKINESGSLVFHGILTHLREGDMMDYLFVSKYKDEWPFAEEDAKQKVALSCCYSPYASEIGYVQVEPKMGGLTRTY